MKSLLKTTLVVALAVGLVVAFAPKASAFHDAGVAHCNGCHTMHNSEDGALVDPDSPGGNAWLLVDATPSDTCLNCHATRLGAVFSADPLAPDPMKGAGNFTFLMEDNLNDGHNGALNPISGDAAGHNLDAPGHGLAPDATLASAPGGAYPAGVMGCSSCHDPHGTDEFRMLYSSGRIVTQGGHVFLNAAPDADGLSIFFGSEANDNHTAYKDGMSGWCGNCHGDFHDAGASLIHPSGAAIGGTIANNYNLYNGTSDLTGGVAATAYLAEVPFEDAANTTASTAGPTAASRVMCATCHRAHASSAPDSGRWDFNVTLLHEDGAESASYALPDPYADVNQRSLCNKCHVKDAYDHIAAP
jgi:predicted CXXCH cytochrome family protein